MRTYLIVSFGLLLTSCNQGSGGSAPPAPPALAPANVAISTDNATQVAQAGVRGSLDIMRLSYIGARFLQTTFPEPTGSGSGTGQSGLASSLLSTDVFGPQQGVATFSWDDVDDDGVSSSGEVFAMNFADYGDQGMVLNGTMTIDELLLQGLLPGDGTYLADATLNLLGLKVQIGVLEQTFNTEIPFLLDNRIIVEVFDVLLLNEQVIGQFEVQRGTRLQRYTTDETLRYSLEGAVHSAELEGLLRFSTPLGLRGSPFLNDPIEGFMQIRGSGGSTMEIEPFCLFPGVCLSLDLRIDADGDEEFEESLSSSWQALLPQ